VSATGISLDLVRELATICGEQHVSESALPNAISVSPSSVDEVAAILLLAGQRNFGVTPVGGAGEIIPAQARTEVLLHTSRLTQVEHYDHSDLTVGVGAGTTVAQLNALVGVDKLMFACDPPFPESATIGGVVAAAAHGPMRHGYGAVRDFCIGIRFVTGDGRKAKAGGRVVKNVAGYDLMKLLIGSYGTLAVITSASFKLFPTPRQTRTFIAEFSTWQEALQFRDMIVRSPLSPMCLELVSPRARKRMRPEMNPERSNDAWVICVRGAGSDAVLARYRKELGSAVTRELEGESEAQMWRAVENFPGPQKLNPEMPSSSSSRDRTPFSLFAPPAELGSVLQLLEETSDPEMATAACIGRCGIGHLLIHFEAANPQWDEHSHAKSVRQRMPASVQFLSEWQDLAIFPWMSAVKRAIDPSRILLRGRELF
jgi:glycolate oxidase FAD binding subunit